MFKLDFGYHPDSLTGSGVPLIQLSEMAPQYVLAIALQMIYTHYIQYTYYAYCVNIPRAGVLSSSFG